MQLFLHGLFSFPHFLSFNIQNNVKCTFFITWRMNSATTQAHNSSLHGRCWTSAHPRSTEQCGTFTQSNWGRKSPVRCKNTSFMRGKESSNTLFKKKKKSVYYLPVCPFENEGSMRPVQSLHTVSLSLTNAWHTVDTHWIPVKWMKDSSFK